MNTGWRKNYLRYKRFFLDIVRIYKKREDLKTYLEITLSIVTIIIFSVFALRPTLLTISQLLNEIDTKEDTIEQMDAKIEALGRARALYENEQRRINLVNIAVPETASVDTFTQQAEGLAFMNSVELSKISINNVLLKGQNDSQDKKASSEESLPITLSVDGSFHTVTTYLSDVTNLRRPIQKSSVKINSALDQEKNQFINLIIEGQLPYLNELQ